MNNTMILFIKQIIIMYVAVSPRAKKNRTKNKNPNNFFKNFLNFFKKIRRILLILLLLWLLWWLFSHFNLWNKIGDVTKSVSHVFEKPIYRWIIPADQTWAIKDSKAVFLPIWSWYYEVIWSDSNIEKVSIIDKWSIVIPEINYSCNIDKKDRHLSSIKYSNFVNTYLQKKAKKEIKIAILDSGIDPYNTILSWRIAKNIWEIAWNNKDDDNDWFIDNEYWANVSDIKGNPIDQNGHGTHVAGIISSLSPNAKIVPIKISSSNDDTIINFDLIKGLEYAISQKVDIINMSFWWFDTQSDIEKGLINLAVKNWIIVIAAAWNDWSDVKMYYPANYNGVLSVWALNLALDKAEFSNYGDINSWLPGECIYSTYLNNEFAFMDWTSMSTPILVGLLSSYESLELPLNKNETEIVTLLNNNSDITNNGIKLINAEKLFWIENITEDMINDKEYIIWKIEEIDKITTEYKNILESDDTEESIKSDFNQFKIEYDKIANFNEINRRIQNIEKIYNEYGLNISEIKELKDEIENDRIMYENFFKRELKLDISSDNKLMGSLWIETCMWEDNCWLFDSIISANSYLPAIGSWRYYTLYDYQTDVLVDIYQWDNTLAKNNQLLWSLTISNLPKQKAWLSSVDVHFNIDKNWYLWVRVVDNTDFNNRKQTTIKWVKSNSNLDKGTLISEIDVLLIEGKKNIDYNKKSIIFYRIWKIGLYEKISKTNIFYSNC